MDQTLFEQRLKAIQMMPEGPQKQQAIMDLSRDYQGRMQTQRGNLKAARGDLIDAMTMPQTRTAGPAGNPFAVAVAPNPMEYLAKGLQMYDANKRRRKAQDELSELSAGQERGLGAVMGAGMGGASPANADLTQAMTNAGFGRVGRGGSTADQYLDYLRRKEEEELFGL